MSRKKPIVAIVYDFDKTLSTDDMQNFSSIPNLDMKSDEFWEEANKLSDKAGMDRILCYMLLMIRQCQEKGISLTREYLNSLGKEVQFFNGVTTWFKRINKFADELGIKVEHYIVSSGTREIIEGTDIAKEFKQVYACEFLYDKDGIACWPKFAVNYTVKTQYIFRISKGILDPNDDVNLNSKSEKHRIPFRNIVYIGDGLTDVPCMLLVKERGGKSIAIYPKGQKNKVEHLYRHGRVNYICKGDYSQGSDIEKIIKLIINQASITDLLLDKEVELAQE